MLKCKQAEISAKSSNTEIDCEGGRLCLER